MCVQEEQIGDEQLEYLNLRYVTSETTSSCFRFEDNNGFSRDVGYTTIMLHQVNVLLIWYIKFFNLVWFSLFQKLFCQEDVAPPEISWRSKALIFIAGLILLCPTSNQQPATRGQRVHSFPPSIYIYAPLAP